MQHGSRFTVAYLMFMVTVDHRKKLSHCSKFDRSKILEETVYSRVIFFVDLSSVLLSLTAHKCHSG
jgi:hypothetical protein